MTFLSRGRERCEEGGGKVDAIAAALSRHGCAVGLLIYERCAPPTTVAEGRLDNEASRPR